MTIEFFNKNAPVDELVSVLDAQVFRGVGASTNGEDVFVSLHQWRDMTVQSARESLVSRASLGSPMRNAFEFRKLSGFKTTISIRRDPGAAFAKGLVPFYRVRASLRLVVSEATPRQRTDSNFDWCSLGHAVRACLGGLPATLAIGAEGSSVHQVAVTLRVAVFLLCGLGLQFLLRHLEIVPGSLALKRARSRPACAVFLSRPFCVF